jgi:hypothetical protein
LLFAQQIFTVFLLYIKHCGVRAVSKLSGSDRIQFTIWLKSKGDKVHSQTNITYGVRDKSHRRDTDKVLTVLSRENSLDDQSRTPWR